MKLLDQTELKIISLLQQDGRMPLSKIAEILSTTDITVRRKVRRLIKDKIMRISVSCNPYDVGFSSPVIIGISVEQEKDVDIAMQLTSLPEVQFVAITTGPYEIISHVAVKSNQKLHDFLTKIGSIDGVKSTQTFLMLKILEKNWNIADYTSKGHSDEN